jgi:hypothetical protein
MENRKIFLKSIKENDILKEKYKKVGGTGQSLKMREAKDFWDLTGSVCDFSVFLLAIAIKYIEQFGNFIPFY